MIIDKTNAQKINPTEIYLHDDVFIGVRFDRAACRAIAFCSGKKKGNYEVSFFNVLSIEMTSCDFWGPSPYIDCINIVKESEQIMIPKIQKNFERYSMPDDPTFDIENYIEIILSFVSGDYLRVVCKSIQISNQGTVLRLTREPPISH